MKLLREDGMIQITVSYRDVDTEVTVTDSFVTGDPQSIRDRAQTYAAILCNRALQTVEPDYQELYAIERRKKAHRHLAKVLALYEKGAE